MHLKLQKVIQKTAEATGDLIGTEILVKLQNHESFKKFTVK